MTGGNLLLTVKGQMESIHDFALEGCTVSIVAEHWAYSHKLSGGTNQVS